MLAAGPILIGLAFGLAVAWPAPELPAKQPVPSLALQGITVVDVENGRQLPDRTVLVAGTRITRVAPDGDVPLPPGTVRVDARGKFLIPGLWDMHAHITALSPLLDLPLPVSFGVTHVRDMLGCPGAGDPFIACPEEKRRWSREALAHQRVGPHIVESPSFMANGTGMVARLGEVPDYFDVDTPERARAFVRHFAGQVDAIKVYDGIPRAAYLALADEARRHGLPLVGHKPRAVDAIEAARHQKSLEHARFLLHDGFAGAEALRQAAATGTWAEDRRTMVDTLDEARVDAILEAMARHGTYYVPTHLTRWSDAFADQPSVQQDPALEFVHPLLEMQWREDVDALLARDPDPAARQAYRDFHAAGLALTARAHAAGVRVMAGSDYIAPGLDLHRELALLVEAGLTPAEALRAATITPARYADALDDYGSVEAGKVADLVLLDADPLADIRNTRRIVGVVHQGAYYDADSIEEIRGHVRRNACSWTVGAKIVWRFVRHPANY